MIPCTKISLATALCLALSLPAAAQDAAGSAAPGASTVVATVGDTDITLGHMIAMRSRLPQQFADMPDEELFQGILDQLIQQEALAQQAGEPSQRTALVVENERRSLMANDVLQQAVRDAVTEEALQEAYDAEYGEAAPAPEYNASHILVETEEEAQALRAELEAGADFAELARAHSTGPSGPSGGELGWFGPGMMVPEFEQTVEGLEVDEVSEPVQTQFGWHLVKLNDQRQQTPPPLQEARAALAQQIQYDSVQAAVEGATGAVDVERHEAASQIDPSLLSNSALLD